MIYGSIVLHLVVLAVLHGNTKRIVAATATTTAIPRYMAVHTMHNSFIALTADEKCKCARKRKCKCKCKGMAVNMAFVMLMLMLMLM